MFLVLFDFKGRLNVPSKTRLYGDEASVLSSSERTGEADIPAC